MTTSTSAFNKDQVGEVKRRRFITKEFAETIAGKTARPYFRLHDPAQKMLADQAAATRGQPLHETAYTERMIHFWREVSLAGLPRTGGGMDECYALLFEAAFDLAEAEPEWALECLDQKTRPQLPWGMLSRLTHFTAGRQMSHGSLVDGFAAIYAPLRKRDNDWKDERCVVASGVVWVLGGSSQLDASAGLIAGPKPMAKRLDHVVSGDAEIRVSLTT